MKKIKAILVLMFLTAALVSMIGVSAQECGPTPTDGCVITQSTTFSSETGIFFLTTGGIRIQGADIVLDMNGTKIIGIMIGGVAGIRADNAANITIKNGVIEKYDYGIDANGSSGIIIKDITFNNVGYAVRLGNMYQGDAVIQSNVISGATKGVFMMPGNRANIVITDNRASNLGPGPDTNNYEVIGVESYSGSTLIENNILSTNQNIRAVIVTTGSNVLIRNNQLSGVSINLNVCTSPPCTNMTVDSNTFNGLGVRNYITIDGVIFTNNRITGPVTMDNSMIEYCADNAKISNNYIDCQNTQSSFGFDHQCGSGNLISGNTITNCANAYQLYPSTPSPGIESNNYNTITNNIITNINRDGIVIESSFNKIISNILNNVGGIPIQIMGPPDNSGYNTVMNNVITNTGNSEGCSISIDVDSSINLITNNTIDKNICGGDGQLDCAIGTSQQCGTDIGACSFGTANCEAVSDPNIPPEFAGYGVMGSCTGGVQPGPGTTDLLRAGVTLTPAIDFVSDIDVNNGEGVKLNADANDDLWYLLDEGGAPLLIAENLVQWVIDNMGFQLGGNHAGIPLDFAVDERFMPIDCASAGPNDFYTGSENGPPSGLLLLMGPSYPACVRNANNPNEKWEIHPTALGDGGSSLTFDVYQVNPGTCTLVCTDEDNDGLKAEGGACGAEDQCPSIPGKAEFNGCPAGIKVNAVKHTIDSTTSKPRAVKYPLPGLFVAAFDKAQGSCAANYGISWQNYPAIDTNCKAVSGCTTGADGTCVIGVPTGDYLVIGRKLTVQGSANTITIDDKHLGNSIGAVPLGQLKTAPLQLLEVPDLSGGSNKKLPASSQKITGSFLEITQPDYVVWSGTEELYPFIFTSDSDWSVDVCLLVPEGYKPVEGCLQEFVNGETKVLQFRVVEVGSIPGDTEVTFNLQHKDSKGKAVKQKATSKIGSKMTKQLEKAKAGKAQGRSPITGAATYRSGEPMRSLVIVATAGIAVIAALVLLMLHKKK